MADNVSITPGTGNSIAADEIAGVKHQRVKVQFGADGSATDVSSSDRLPVEASQSGSWSVTANAGTNLNTSALALESGGNLAAAATSLATLDNIVSGGEAQVDVITSALPTGAATSANQDIEIGHLENLVGFEIPPYDEIDITYVAVGNGVGEIETVVYSMSSTPVATLTLSYDGDNKLSNIIRS